MSHKIKDGYHIIYGWEFTVKDGRVYHAMQDGTRYEPYKPTYIRSWAGRQFDGWSNCAGMTYDAFRAAMRRGTIVMYKC